MSTSPDLSVADAFRTAFGGDPDGVWSAPGRVNLIGEHTDYNGGWVLPFAIDMRTSVAGRRRDDGRIVVRSVQLDGETSAVLDEISPSVEHTWATYVLGTVWALRDAGHEIGGVELLVDGRVPVGSGLSSSAALEIGAGAAAAGLWGATVDPADLAKLAQYGENTIVGVPCGLMDQMASAVCQADHALFFDTRDDVREQEPFAPAAEGLAVVVIDTRAKHSHADGAYAQRRRTCEAAARALGVGTLREIPLSGLDAAVADLHDDESRRRVWHVVTENARVLETIDLLRAGKLREIGPLLTASHRSLRDDYEVSCAELDVAVDTALEAGALGARMTGGGFGGSAIALVAADRVDQLTAAVRQSFADKGFTAPGIFVPHTADGVRRDA